MSLKNKSTDALDLLYTEIKSIDAKDKCSLPEAICKLAEEHGELIRAANKTFGRKVHSQSTKEINSEVLEEVADTLQNLLLICGRYKFTLADIIETTHSKNKKWVAQLDKRKKIKTYFDREVEL